MMKALVFVCVLLFAPLCVAQDSWTGPDKKKHFAVSAAAGFLCKGFFPPARDSDLIAVGCGVLPGLVKEIGDAQEEGNRFSGKDLAWDLAGAFVGVKLGGLMISRHGSTTTVAYSMSF